jgi:predicted CopG family antitoxin
MSHQIRLDDDVYERIKANKQEGETFSEAVERLIGGHSLSELADVFDDEAAEGMREAIDTADKRDRENARDIAQRFE